MSLTLYRGDHYLNERTQPGIYRGNGLTSKAFFGKGDPAYIDQHGLLETIRQHINPQSKHDFNTYDTTGYLSFSTNRKKALEWAANKKGGLIEVPDDHQETRYLFKASFNDSDLIKITDYLYKFKFACNRFLKESNAPSSIFSFVSTQALQYNVCDICNNTLKCHSILLIDAVSFLKDYRHLEKYDGAFENASEDSEWLVLPNTSLRQGSYRSARIQRSDFWTVKHFRLSNEAPRDSNYFKDKGII